MKKIVNYDFTLRTFRFTLKLMPFLKVIHSKLLIVNGKNQKSIHHSPFTIHFKVKHGFTLIELLVVISIIAILIAAVSASFINAQQKGRDGRRKSDLKSVQQALELYLQNKGEYPVASADGEIVCNVSLIYWGDSFACDSITYIQQLPKDPDITKSYYYNATSDFTYILSAALENTNDPEYCVSTGSNCVATKKLPCEPQSDRNYCVINP